MKILIISILDKGMKGGNQLFSEKLVVELNKIGCKTKQTFISFNEQKIISIFKAYVQAKKIKTKGYDIVISIKYPGYCVKHPAHITLLNHRYKRFYSLWSRFKKEMKPLERIMMYLLRIVIKKIDTKALKDNIVIAQSGTIKKRLFQENIISIVNFPPAIIESRKNINYKNFFLLPGRLDNYSKRIDLVIKSFELIKNNKSKLYITGTGKDEKKLKELAFINKNIIFTGYLSKDKLASLFANAKAVINPAFDEDYGLITIEAMKNKKMVITFTDSGGPTELVKNMHSGIITLPKPERLAGIIDYLAINPDEVKRMGKNAFEQTKDISWDNYIKKIFFTLEKDYLITQSSTDEEKYFLSILQDNEYKPISLNWDFFIDLVAYHQLIHIILKKANFLPDSVRQKFLMQLFIIKKKNEQTYAEYSYIKTIFEKNVIPYMPFKGITKMIEHDFERPTADIDILIRKKDITKAILLLNKNGFSYLDDMVHELHYHEFIFGKYVHKKNTMLELKTALDRHMPLTFEQLHKSNYKKELFFCFDAHHALIDHPFQNMKWLYEAKVRFEEEHCNVKKILFIAKKLNITKTVRIYLLLLNKLLHANINVSPSKKEKEILDFFFKLHNGTRLNIDKNEYFKISCAAKIILAENRKEKIKACINALFPKLAEINVHERKFRFTYYWHHLKNKRFKKLLRRAMSV